MQSDAFQFGSYIDWSYPREWKRMKPEWREIYSSKLSLRVVPNVKIKQFGTTRQSVVHTLEQERGDEN
ncbi:hypothetical protein BK138_34305 [Paenibacillus rhizosphaerae]|uniref:Spore germination GerAC-like C-terminal domain-containing protein n=1 Tax=Paenibacillus rhizosphaerae TaxID=297318 RepID=A0A1R1DZ08_9BACL|nr:hypothetical protein BK138_34305 [Paenibacillus rhizosphaerae]